MFSLTTELEALRAEGVIDPVRADELLARERREVVSVYTELRFLAWGGVMLLASGIGVFIARNYDVLGPIAIAVLVGLAAAGCYVWTWWKESRAHSPIDDYILLLGSLLLSADVGYVEHQFHLLGAHWQRHLLLLAAVHAAVAYRFGSKMVLSLSLAAFASWMGLERNVETIFNSNAQTGSRALACAAAVLAWRYVDARLRDRPDFSPVFEHFATNLAFWGALCWTFDADMRWLGCAVTLVLAAIAAWHGVRMRSEMFVLYAAVYGIIAVDVAICDVLHEPVLIAVYLSVSTIAAIFGLTAIHSRFREDA